MSGAVIVAIIAVVVSVGAVALARQQVIEARRATAVSALAPFFEQWHSPAMKETRRRLYDNEINLGKMSKSDEVAVKAVLDRLEFLGALVQNKIVGVTVIQTMFWHSPPQVWGACESFVLRQRTSLRPHYGESFEKLVRAYGERPNRFRRFRRD